MDHKLNSLQVLRAVAAISVVAHHVFRATTIMSVPLANSILPAPWLVQFGAVGVDIFFIISGFLMTYISEPYFSGRKTKGQFLAQRIIRIWPPYVVATLVAILLLVLKHLLGHSAGALPLDLQAHRLASMVFIPSFNDRGLLQPIIGPGWTLNYEMTFYICFTLTLYFGRHWAFFTLATIIALLFLTGRFIRQEVVHTFLGDPILFEFLIGAAIGFALKSRRLNLSHGWAWIVAAVACYAAMYRYGFGVEQRLLAYGLPSAILFIGFMALERTINWPAVLLLFGNASYSIYLVHTLVIYHVVKVGFYQRLHFGNWSTLVASLVAIALAILAGLLFYWFVEKPLLRACQNLYNYWSGQTSKPPLVAQ